VPRAGGSAATYRYRCSVDRRLEVKGRANGFARLYGWLDGADMLVIKADRKEPLVVILLGLAAEIAVAAERNRTCDHG
jgi:hypothetical protein